MRLFPFVDYEFFLVAVKCVVCLKQNFIKLRAIIAQLQNLRRELLIVLLERATHLLGSFHNLLVFLVDFQDEVAVPVGALNGGPIGEPEHVIAVLQAPQQTNPQLYELLIQ